MACVNIFELRDLPAHRSSNRGFVFIICIVHCSGCRNQTENITHNFYVPCIVELSCVSYKLRGGGCMAQRWRFDLALGDSMLRNFVIQILIL